MKILHLMLGNFFIDGYTYQENLLPKYHKKHGHEVEIIASQQTINKDAALVVAESSDYINENGLHVRRLPYKNPLKLFSRFRRYQGTYEAIEKINTDVMFIHGCQFLDIDKVVKYLKKNPQITVYVDNHADFMNSGSNWLSRNVLHKIVWRSCAKKIAPYAKKFYGVVPGRVGFLRDVYKVPAEKAEYLPMGADTEIADEIMKQDNRKIINEKFGIKDSDFLVVSGGKLDALKPQSLLLLKAVINMNRDDVKLLFFGSVAKSYKEEFEKLCKDEHIIYAGWADLKQSYEYFCSADLVVFPGNHSVYWEQAIYLGKPCIFRKYDGYEQVELGGNCLMLVSDSEDEIKEKLEELYNDREKLISMGEVAKQKGGIFSFDNIAYVSIEENKPEN